MKIQIKEKRLKGLCLGVVIALLLTWILPLMTYAAEIEKYYVTGDYANGFNLITNEDTIFMIGNAVPGDVHKEQIIIKNIGKETMEVRISDISSNLLDTSLYDALILKISKDGTVLYEGSYGQTEEPITNFFIVDGRNQIALDIEVIIPEYADNKLQGKKMESTWTFEANYHNIEKIKTGVFITSPELTETIYPVVIVISLMLICISLFTIIFIKKKEKQKDDDN